MNMPDSYFPNHGPPPEDTRHDTGEPDEATLIARLRAGDEAAFRRVVLVLLTLAGAAMLASALPRALA